MDVRDPSFRLVEEDAPLRRIVDTIVEALDPEQIILFGVPTEKNLLTLQPANVQHWTLEGSWRVHFLR